MSSRRSSLRGSVTQSSGSSESSTPSPVAVPISSSSHTIYRSSIIMDDADEIMELPASDLEILFDEMKIFMSSPDAAELLTLEIFSVAECDWFANRQAAANRKAVQDASFARAIAAAQESALIAVDVAQMQTLSGMLPTMSHLSIAPSMASGASNSMSSPVQLAFGQSISTVPLPAAFQIASTLKYLDEDGADKVFNGDGKQFISRQENCLVFRRLASEPLIKSTLGNTLDLTVNKVKTKLHSSFSHSIEDSIFNFMSAISPVSTSSSTHTFDLVLESQVLLQLPVFTSDKLLLVFIGIDQFDLHSDLGWDKFMPPESESSAPFQFERRLDVGVACTNLCKCMALVFDERIYDPLYTLLHQFTNRGDIQRVCTGLQGISFLVDTLDLALRSLYTVLRQTNYVDVNAVPLVIRPFNNLLWIEWFKTKLQSYVFSPETFQAWKRTLETLRVSRNLPGLTSVVPRPVKDIKSSNSKRSLGHGKNSGVDLDMDASTNKKPKSLSSSSSNQPPSSLSYSSPVTTSKGTVEKSTKICLSHLANFLNSNHFSICPHQSNCKFVHVQNLKGLKKHAMISYIQQQHGKRFPPGSADTNLLLSLVERQID